MHVPRATKVDNRMTDVSRVNKTPADLDGHDAATRLAAVEF